VVSTVLLIRFRRSISGSKSSQRQKAFLRVMEPQTYGPVPDQDLIAAIL
jgi:hypothetical protein